MLDSSKYMTPEKNWINSSRSQINMLNRTLMRTKFNELHVYVFNIPASGKLNVLTPASTIPLGL